MNLHGILKKGQGRRLFAVSAVAALGLAIGAAPSMATVGDMHSVTFCHRNSDTKDPYVVGITTDSAAIIGPTGHSGHTGPVFNLTGGKTQPAWGDIIPAFDYVDSAGVTQHYGGLNVDTATGLDFLANGCKLPEGPHLSTLTLVKEVVNTGGGKATAIDWTLTAAGTSSFEGTTPVSSDVVVPGDYKLSETAHSDAQNSAYKASAWDCGSMYGSIAVTESTVTVGENANVTCTITNTFVPPPPPPHTALLTLVKVVNKDAGGSALVTAWTLDATGGPTDFAEGTTGVNQQVADGTYTLSELPAATTNYTASAWDCSNTEVNGTTVIIGLHDTAVTCTITNTYVPPRTPVVPLTTVAALTFTPGTCLAVGSVAATKTSAYEWVVTGLETARSYQAVANSGFTLSGTTAFGPFDLSQLSSDSAACFVAPAAVAPAAVAPAAVAPPAVAPTVAVVVKNAPAAAPAVAPAVKTLAFTGAETVPLGLSGLLALVLGAVLTVASRQRPKQARE